MTLKALAVAGALAHNAKDEKDAPLVYDGFAMEPKLDGWRILAEVADGHVTFYTRTGNSHKIPHVEAALLAHFPAGSWLDGEMVASGGWGSVQSQLSSHVPTALKQIKGATKDAAVNYVVFDLLAHRDIDARSLPYSKRRKLLEQAFAAWPKGTPVELVGSFPASEIRHEELVAAGAEGTVLKRLSGSYASGKRGHGWRKLKEDATEDMVVMGFEAGTDVGAVVLGQFVDGKLVQRATAKRKPNLIPTPDLMEWAGRVIEVKHNGVQKKTGALRHPRMVRVRDDKFAAQCLWI